MKNKNIIHCLLNSLINIDFLVLKKHYVFSHLNIFNLIKIHKNLFLHFLNPLTTIINLKQFFRILYFFKKLKSKKPIFNFFVQGRHQELIIKKFFTQNKINLKCNIYFRFLLLKQKKEFSQFILTLQDLTSKQLNLSNKLLAKKIFLAQEINSFKNQNSIGSYKICNNLSDYKKLIFILVFVKQI